MERSGALRRRIVQIHPTRHCNLRCRHCYSESGPEVRESLPPELICDFLTDAATHGYEVAGFSGGEPLLYPELPAVLHHAKSLGLVTTVTTNGMLLGRRQVEVLAGLVDLLAISLDGVPASHNRLRNSPRAFKAMTSHLPRLRAAGFAFGFIHTVTPASLPELRWLAEFAVEQGARLLQLHPLELFGWAAQKLAGDSPPDDVCTRVYLLVSLLEQEFGDQLRFQVDLFDRDLVREHPELVFAGEKEPERQGALSDLVNPLVLETSGDVAPVCYGFGRRYRLGNIRQSRLANQVDQFRDEIYPAFRALCREVWREVVASDELPYFNWYEFVAKRSRDALF